MKPINEQKGNRAMEENTNFSTGTENSGQPAYSAPVAAAPVAAPVPPKKKTSAGKIAALILALAVTAGAAFAAGALLPKKEASPAVPVVAANAGAQERQQAGTDAEPTEKKTEPADYAPIENHGFSLPGGRYVVGEDLPAGKYLFTYQTTMESDYWTNDYLWITYAGSEGKNETWGGDHYDDRVGSVKYEEALVGKSFYFNLHDGDMLRVDSEFGEWTY